MKKIVFITPNFIHDTEFLSDALEKPIVFNPNALFSTLNWKLTTAEWVEISANAINVIMDALKSNDLLISNFPLGTEISTLAEYLKDFYEYDVYWVIPNEEDIELSIQKNIEVYYSNPSEINKDSIKYKALLSGIQKKYKYLENTPNVKVKRISLSDKYNDIFKETI